MPTVQSAHALLATPPTTSLGCLSVWYALVMEGAENLRVVECAWESSSPSGSLPCVERDGRLLVAGHDADDVKGTNDADDIDDMKAAEAVLDVLDVLYGARGGVEGQGHGLGQGRAAADDLAVRALILGNVVPGVSASMWLDAECYAVLAKAVFGGRLPWPLKRWLPDRVQRRVRSSTGVSRDALVRRAVESLGALHAVADEDENARKEQGTRAMSVRTRALLAAVCTTIRCFPVCSAVRRAARGLDGWLDGIVRDMSVGVVPAALADARWEGVRARDGDGPRQQREKNEDGKGDQEGGGMDQTSTYWLVGIGALASLYAVMLLRESVEFVEVED